MAWTRSGNFSASWIKKDGNVIADQVEIALFGVKLHGKPAHVSGEVR
jgi:hypothetical protein